MGRARVAGSGTDATGGSMTAAGASWPATDPAVASATPSTHQRSRFIAPSVLAAHHYDPYERESSRSLPLVSAKGEPAIHTETLRIRDLGSVRRLAKRSRERQKPARRPACS